MAERIRLAAVYAHPDDDTNGIGALLAANADRIHYTLICCTSGEAGEIADPSLATRENLATVREREERDAIAALGVYDADINFLHHPDGALASVPREPLVEEVTAVLRDARPQVVITFGPEGVTRHADHICAGEVGTAAFHRMREEGARVQRLYYVALPKTLLDRYWNALLARGRVVNPDAPFMPQGIPDGQIDVRVEMGDAIDRKIAGIEAHRTQNFHFIPEDLRRELFVAEHFVQAWPPREAGAPRRTSLFDGLEGEPQTSVP
jgi:LmbE family N-acetylglucosaminyl deacetylase